ncbi:MarR family winged helix-turn-helix transcriptional regulator [Raoultibacter timonensis]|uniref:MarR family winged helix-turn-helix transcriptional regulator n=1 Tax=Raoultibacter timonensis TaxID=1907662 RepID=UPI000C855F7B|nr:MarR family transcriptional regulator [Raoultibacter timonensis]
MTEENRQPEQVQEPLSEGALKRRAELDELLSSTFNSVLRTEEKSLQNKLTEGLTITEIHTIVAVGLHETNPMNVVAARLGVTLATLTTAVNKLVDKGFITRTRCIDDRRKVLISLTKRGKQVYRAHGLFHRRMINEALAELDEEEERVFAHALVKVKAFFDEQD